MITSRYARSFRPNPGRPDAPRMHTTSGTVHLVKSGASERRSTSACMAVSSGRVSNVSAAASTCGRTFTSPTVFRKTPARPSTQCTASSMSFWSVSGSYQVLAVCSRPSHGAERDRLDRLHATPRSAQTRPAPRSPPRSARPASGGSCTARAPSRRGSARGCAVHAGHGQPVPGDADEAHQALLASLHRGLEGAALAQRGLPVDHVDQVVQLDQVEGVDAEALERAADLLARARAVALAGLGGQEERVAVARQPGREAQLGVAVATRRRRCGSRRAAASSSSVRSASAWRHLPSAAAPKIVRVLSWPVLPNGALAIMAVSLTNTSDHAHLAAGHHRRGRPELRELSRRPAPDADAGPRPPPARLRGRGRADEAEWEAAIAILTASGDITSDSRQEFVLWSDALGLSMLVDALAQPAARRRDRVDRARPVLRAGRAAARLRRAAERAGRRPGLGARPGAGRRRRADRRRRAGRLAERREPAVRRAGSRAPRTTTCAAATRPARTGRTPSSASARARTRSRATGRSARCSTRPGATPGGPRTSTSSSGPGLPQRGHPRVRRDSAYLDSDAVFAVKPSLLRTFVPRDRRTIPARPAGVDGPWCSVENDLVLAR